MDVYWNNSGSILFFVQFIEAKKISEDRSYTQHIRTYSCLLCYFGLSIQKLQMPNVGWNSSECGGLLALVGCQLLCHYISDKSVRCLRQTCVPPLGLRHGRSVTAVLCLRCRPCFIFYSLIVSVTECAKNITWILLNPAYVLKMDTTIHSLHSDISMSCSETSCPFKAIGPLVLSYF